MLYELSWEADSAINAGLAIVTGWLFSSKNSSGDIKSFIMCRHIDFELLNLFIHREHSTEQLYRETDMIVIINLIT